MLRTVAVVYPRETIQSVRLYFMFRLPLVARVRFSRFNYGYIKSGIRSDPEEVVVLWSLMRFGEAALPRGVVARPSAHDPATPPCTNTATSHHCQRAPLLSYPTQPSTTRLPILPDRLVYICSIYLFLICSSVRK